jgi:hypothetical protein
MRTVKEMVGGVIEKQLEMPEVGFGSQNKPECIADLFSPPLFACVTRLAALRVGSLGVE